MSGLLSERLNTIIARVRRAAADLLGTDQLKCPECRSALGIYRYSSSAPQAWEFGPCRNCFTGLIYDDTRGTLRLRRLLDADIKGLKGDPGAILNYTLVEGGTPEKNQRALFLPVLSEASRLLSKDEFAKFVFAFASLPFAATRGLMSAVFSNASDEDKRKLFMAVASSSV